MFCEYLARSGLMSWHYPLGSGGIFERPQPGLSLPDNIVGQSTGERSEKDGVRYSKGLLVYGKCKPKSTAVQPIPQPSPYPNPAPQDARFWAWITTF